MKSKISTLKISLVKLGFYLFLCGACTPNEKTDPPKDSTLRNNLGAKRTNTGKNGSTKSEQSNGNATQQIATANKLKQVEDGDKQELPPKAGQPQESQNGIQEETCAKAAKVGQDSCHAKSTTNSDLSDTNHVGDQEDNTTNSDIEDTKKTDHEEDNTANSDIEDTKKTDHEEDNTANSDIEDTKKIGDQGENNTNSIPPKAEQDGGQVKNNNKDQLTKLKKLDEQLNVVQTADAEKDDINYNLEPLSKDEEGDNISLNSNFSSVSTNSKKKGKKRIDKIVKDFTNKVVNSFKKPKSKNTNDITDLIGEDNNSESMALDSHIEEKENELR